MLRSPLSEKKRGRKGNRMSVGDESRGVPGESCFSLGGTCEADCLLLCTSASITSSLWTVFSDPPVLSLQLPPRPRLTENHAQACIQGQRRPTYVQCVALAQALRRLSSYYRQNHSPRLSEKCLKAPTCPCVPLHAVRLRNISASPLMFLTALPDVGAIDSVNPSHKKRHSY